MKRIGLLGCGKIGRALAAYIRSREDAALEFVQDPKAGEDLGLGCRILREPDEDSCKRADLVVESATADALKETIEIILRHCDLMPFSVTAFSDLRFEQRVRELCQIYGHTVYIPHGAVLGLDGIFDGSSVWSQVRVETVKNPKSLGRQDTERTLVYEGPTREACRLYPRNVNVHAAIAMAGIGFDRTCSAIVSDPSVGENTHRIHLKGEGINVTLQISSFAGGGVTGAYTPYSACGSLERVLGYEKKIFFV